MWRVYQAFKKAIKDDLEFILLLFTSSALLYERIQFLVGLQSQSTASYPLKITLIIIFGVVLILAFKKAYLRARYGFEINLRREKIRDMAKNDLNNVRIDYSTLLPTTKILEYVKNETMALSKRHISQDVFLNDFHLIIGVGGRSLNFDDGLPSVDVSIRYYSPIAGYTKTFYLRNLELPDKKSVIEEMSRDLDESGERVETHPFYLTRGWKRIVLTAFKNIDGKLIGNSFRVNIFGSKNDFFILFRTEGKVRCSYHYDYKKELGLGTGYGNDRKRVELI